MDARGDWCLRSNPAMASVWKCRLCGFSRYHRVTVLRRNGARYETSFYACSGCSAMFLNPTIFDGWHEVAPDANVPAVVTPLRRRR